MQTLNKLENILFVVVVTLLSLNATFKLTAYFWLTHAQRHVEYTDSWMGERKTVLLPMNSYEVGPYDLHSDNEWSLLVPGDGIIHLGPDHQPAMVSMLHQLRCIDFIRQQAAVTRERRDMELAHHCMNYLRQMTLCRGDTFLDAYEYTSKNEPLDKHPIRRCQDWRAVYEAVEANQRNHARRRAI
ncbi:hypothetical protein CERSUDRAFT_88670 [Gelatoporia subvermispora B]|uniref:Uncharacterized protein n=1 Tax=Ceriporiopsis subvermispora (strain B) TaxID=914234 RepID=M2R0M7_CERS8|nr:hypothetical protein CERSUDRAFT_88670 [Gelatoporia subvermispora B]